MYIKQLHTNKEIGIWLLIITLIGILGGIAEAKFYTYTEKKEVSGSIPIPETNKTCSKPIYADGYYYCDIDNIAEAKNG